MKLRAHCPPCCDVLKSTNGDVLLWSLKVLTNITTGTAEQTNVVIDSSAVLRLCTLSRVQKLLFEH